MSVALLCVAGVALDALLGEPKRWHPLVAFGRMADRIEQRFNSAGRGWRSHGVTAWVLAVLPLTILATALSWLPYIGWLVEILALYCALGMRSLGEHVQPVAEALRANDLDEARTRVGYLVSRQTSELDATEVARAATESVLENGFKGRQRHLASQCIPAQQQRSSQLLEAHKCLHVCPVLIDRKSVV